MDRTTELKGFRKKFEEAGNLIAVAVIDVILLLGKFAPERINYALDGALLPAWNMNQIQTGNFDLFYMLEEREWELNGKGGRVGANVGQ